MKAYKETERKYYKYQYNEYSIDVTAQEQTVIDGTESDYDFYEDIGIYKLPKIDETYYGIGD